MLFKKVSCDRLFCHFSQISDCLCARDTKYWKKPNFLDTYTEYENKKENETLQETC